MPFKIYSGEDLGYLRQGISQMLESRLSWEGHILIIEVCEDSIKKTKSITNVGQGLYVDCVFCVIFTISLCY
ncbi:MAG: hypothetical protein J7J44_02460, partial [Deltaproteobacteria bacterium]|nr:hypothetical protein [Deltaproteobacteria bacterium]